MRPHRRRRRAPRGSAQQHQRRIGLDPARRKRTPTFSFSTCGLSSAFTTGTEERAGPEHLLEGDQRQRPTRRRQLHDRIVHRRQHGRDHRLRERPIPRGARGDSSRPAWHRGGRAAPGPRVPRPSDRGPTPASRGPAGAPPPSPPAAPPRYPARAADRTSRAPPAQCHAPPARRPSTPDAIDREPGPSETRAHGPPRQRRARKPPHAPLVVLHRGEPVHQAPATDSVPSSRRCRHATAVSARRRFTSLLAPKAATFLPDGWHGPSRIGQRSARNATPCASIVARSGGGPVSSSPPRKNFRFTRGATPTLPSALPRPVSDYDGSIRSPDFQPATICPHPARPGPSRISAQPAPHPRPLAPD